MKTDKDYYYPETPKELSAFYGMECEVELDGMSLDNSPSFYRIPKFTLDDLKVGDVVRVLGDKEELIEIKHDTMLHWLVNHIAPMKPIELLISRNLWVEVKV